MSDFGNSQKLSLDFAVKSPGADYYIYPEPIDIPRAIEPFKKLFAPGSFVPSPPGESPRKFIRRDPPIRPSGEPSNSLFTKPTRQELIDVARHGCLVRKNTGAVFSNNPYPDSAVVVCDNCNRKELVAYVHQGKLDLCLPCTENILDKPYPADPVPLWNCTIYPNGNPFDCLWGRRFSN